MAHLENFIIDIKYIGMLDKQALNSVNLAP
jgi:hypothetical protein